MQTGYPYIIQGPNLTVVIGAKTHTISKTHLTYEKVIEAIKANEWDKVKDLIEPKQMIINYGKGNIAIQGETLTYKGRTLHNALSTRMISMIKEGFNIDPMANFLENLMTNPSYRAVTELYGFLEKCNLPITPDGYFLAYKKVRENYTDCHTGSVLNKPYALLTENEKNTLPMNVSGVTVELTEEQTVLSMERNLVDDDRERTCSNGLHFCSRDYLNHFSGERIVIVKINPADVCAIPKDYNDSKGRTSKYVVIGEIENEDSKIEEAFNKPVQSNANNNTAGPVTKTGSTAFYDGYTTGYNHAANGTGYNSDNYYADNNQQLNFEEGYTKGFDAATDGEVPAYQFVGTSKAGKVIPTGGWQDHVIETWPQPK